jgi:hypothetical protein
MEKEKVVEKVLLRCVNDISLINAMIQDLEHGERGGLWINEENRDHRILLRLYKERMSEMLQERIYELEHPFDNIPLGYDKLPMDYYKSDDWKKTEVMILERDEWKCQIKGPRCITVGNFVHHIRSPKNNPQFANAHWNLKTVCKKCHKDIWENHKG